MATVLHPGELAKTSSGRIHREVVVVFGYPEASGVEIVAAHLANRLRCPIVDIMTEQKNLIQSREPQELFQKLAHVSHRLKQIRDGKEPDWSDDDDQDFANMFGGDKVKLDKNIDFGNVQPIPILEVPTALSIALVSNRVLNPPESGLGPRMDCVNGFVLLGCPTTKKQAAHLQEMLKNEFEGGCVTRVVEVRAHENVLVDRLGGNWLHMGSGRRYNLHVKPPQSYLRYKSSENNNESSKKLGGGSETASSTMQSTAANDEKPDGSVMLDDFTNERLIPVQINPEEALKKIQNFTNILDHAMHYFSRGSQHRVAYMLVDGNRDSSRLIDETDNILKQDKSAFIYEDSHDGSNADAEEIGERKSTWTNPYAVTKIRLPKGHIVGPGNKNRYHAWQEKHITQQSEIDSLKRRGLWVERQSSVGRRGFGCCGFGGSRLLGSESTDSSEYPDE